jgi:hypothetical protein
MLFHLKKEEWTTTQEQKIHFHTEQLIIIDLKISNDG